MSWVSYFIIFVSVGMCVVMLHFSKSVIVGESLGNLGSLENFKWCW